MNCPDIEALISYALSPCENASSDVALHVMECSECKENLEIIHDTILAESFVECRVPVVARGNKIADLVVSLSGSLRDGFQNAIKWADTLLPAFDVVPAYAYTTREIGQRAEGRSCSDWSFEKQGENCLLRIAVRPADQGLDVQVKLLEEPGEAVIPFELTVVDEDAGTTLLSKRRFTSGAATLKGVEKGNYRLNAISGEMACGLSLRVE